MPPWLTEVPGGVEIAVLARPRASRSQVMGEHGGMLKIQLAAPPVDGEANDELIETISRLLRVARRQVSLVSGQASRRKRVRVAGVEPAAVVAAMNATR